MITLPASEVSLLALVADILVSGLFTPEHCKEHFLPQFKNKECRKIARDLIMGRDTDITRSLLSWARTNRDKRGLPIK